MVNDRPPGRILAVVISACLLVGCERSREAPARGDIQGGAAPVAARRSISEWVDCLRNAYAHRGVRGFRQERASLEYHKSALTEDPDFDIVAMVMFGTDVTEKEGELTGEMWCLARLIEERPGRALLEWQQLRNKVYSCWFGNGPVDVQSVPGKLIMLYADIAGVGDADRDPTR